MSKDVNCNESQEEGSHQTERLLKETLHKAFWDSLEEQLSASPPALLLLLLPRHNQLRSQIEEALGRELVQQAAERGALGVRGLTMDYSKTDAFITCSVTDESNPSESWRTPGSLPQGSSLTLQKGSY
uniref:Uncharacterized protein n=1 Tax=Strix occidentalis caurina TaxID=311401 RepID=A0A8D0KWS4_STROC